MTARLIINTESNVGYNNQLKQAMAGMKLGVNNQVNPDTIKAGLKLMAGGPYKINPPNSHPSNTAANSKSEPEAVSDVAPTASDQGITNSRKNRANSSHGFATRNKQKQLKPLSR